MRFEQLLRCPEGEQLDFKRDLSSLKGIIKDVCAFSNSSGGELVIGVEDDRTVVGLDDPEGDEEKLANVITDRLEPRPNFSIARTSYGGKEVFIVKVGFTYGPVHLKGKREEEGTYGRYGSTSRTVDEGRLNELRRYRDSQMWDEQPCPNARREDFNDELAERIFAERGVEFSEAALRTNRLLVEYGSDLVPSNAGIVLFGRDRAKFYLDDARWRCIRYPGETKGSKAFDDRDFEDMTLLEALPEVERYVMEHGGSARDIKRLNRTNVTAFSDKVLREVLVNAIAHAHYEVKGSKLDASLYSDRAEVQSPGTWPPGASFQDLQDGISRVRNRAIAKTLRLLRYMEERGTAWARVQEAVADGYPEPAWQPLGTALRVAIPKHPEFSSSHLSQQGSETNETNETTSRRTTVAEARHERLVELLKQRAPGDISVAELPALLKVGRATTYRDIEVIREAGLLRDTSRGRIAASGSSSYLSQQGSETNETNETTSRLTAAAEARHERLVELLKQRAPGDISVAELPALLKVGRATNYRDIEVIREAGLLRDTSRGRIAAAGDSAEGS